MTGWLRWLGGLALLGAVALDALIVPPPAGAPPAPEAVAPVPPPTVAFGAVAADDWREPVLKHLASRGVAMPRERLEALLGVVERHARRFGLDPLTILAIIEVESRFDATAVSPRGAMGLMQIQAETARELAAHLGIPWTSDDLLLEPELNVLLGTAYLAGLIERFGTTETALSAFHIGPGRVEARQAQGLTLSATYANRVWGVLARLKPRPIS